MMKNFISILALGVVLAGCDQKAPPNPKTLLLNRQGNNELKEQRTDNAFAKYVEALRYDPFQSELHLDLGLTLEVQQQAEKAVASYKEADRLATAAGNGEVAFMARFNLGQLYGKAKNYDEALKAYQSALEIIPSSNEVKTNIELLIQQQQGGQGGDSKDQQQQQQDQGDNKKDQKDQKGKDQKDQKDQDDKKDQDQKDQGDKEKEKENKDYQQNSKYKPRPFNGKELSEADVKKILGELKQQEQKIRAEFNRKDVKEQPRDKDW